MKKLRKTLAILSSVMVISACAVSPVCAEECNNLPKFEDLELDLLVSVVKVGSETDLYLKEWYENCICGGDDVVPETVPGTEIRDGIEYIVDEELYNAFMDAWHDETFGESTSYDKYDNVNSNLSSATTLNIRDAAYIARELAAGAKDLINEYPDADYNKDGVVNIRDAAAIAKDLATRN